MSSQTTVPILKNPERVALALHSAQESTDVADMLRQLGIEVAAQGMTIAEVSCDSQRYQAELIIADARAMEGISTASYPDAGEISVTSDGLDAKQGNSADHLPIILIGSAQSGNVSAWEHHERIVGYLMRPFTAQDLSSVIDVVRRNQAEFRWLQQQCETYRNLIERLRQKMAVGQASSIGVDQGKPPSVRTQGVRTQGTTHIQPPSTDGSAELQTFASIPHAIQEVDTVGRIIFSNPAHCRMHGYEPGELASRTVWELLATDVEQAAFRQALEDRLRNAPPPLSYQTRHRRRDGRIIDVQVDWTYKRDRTGELEGYISIITDITQQLQDRTELQRARKNSTSREAKLTEQLQAADQALQQETDRRRNIEKALRHSRRLASLGVIAAGIAHEINNPITAGLNSAETALAISEHATLPPRLRDCIVNVVHATRRCRAIVKDLLKFASQQPTEKRPYSLNYVVKRAIGIVKKVHPNWPASLGLQLSDQGLHVNLNLLEIEVAIANLVQNAMEAARENPAGRVTLSTQMTDDCAILSVSDNGCGIPKHLLEQVFDPFFTTRRAAGGTGLGLSIVYAIVRNHCGEIEVKSTENVGTTFTILFPRFKGEFEGDEPQDTKTVGVINSITDSYLSSDSCGNDLF